MTCLEQLFFTEWLSYQRFDNLSTQVQVPVIQAGVGSKTKPSVIKGVASSQQGFAAIRNEPLLDVLPAWVEKLQDV